MEISHRGAMLICMDLQPLAQAYLTGIQRPWIGQRVCRDWTQVLQGVFSQQARVCSLVLAGAAKALISVLVICNLAILPLHGAFSYIMLWQRAGVAPGFDILSIFIGC